LGEERAVATISPAFIRRAILARSAFNGAAWPLTPHRHTTRTISQALRRAEERACCDWNLPRGAPLRHMPLARYRTYVYVKAISREHLTLSLLRGVFSRYERWRTRGTRRNTGGGVARGINLARSVRHWHRATPRVPSLARELATPVCSYFRSPQRLTSLTLLALPASGFAHRALSYATAATISALPRGSYSSPFKQRLYLRFHAVASR